MPQSIKRSSGHEHHRNGRAVTLALQGRYVQLGRISVTASETDFRIISYDDIVSSLNQSGHPYQRRGPVKKLTNEGRKTENREILVNAGEAPAPEFMRTQAERLPQHEDELMTIAQQLEQKGIEKGRAEGIQLGIEKGRHEGKFEGKLEVARTMLQNGLDRNTVMKMTGLSEDDLAQIRH